MKRIFVFLFCICIANDSLYSQTTLNADGPGDTYELITSILAPRANPIETPDCSHTEFGRHISEVWDSTLNAYVFAFHIHKNEDDDRCINFDRQRNEIKIYDQSPDNLKGVLGETVVYKWKLKMDAGFQPSSNFTHIHQLKAVGGTESSMPQITLTCRAGSPEELELRYAQDSTQVTLASANLSLFKGVWVEATETVTYGEPGSYNLSLSKVSDGSILLSYSNPSIRMWKTDAEFIRPKWGIYRSLNNAQQLRDEIVHFADFYIEELSTTPSTPITGTGEVIITEYHNRPLKPSQIQLDAALPNNPAGADTIPNEGHTEWFEIYNTTNAPVVMDGWTLTDATSSSRVSTISNFTLAANSYAVFSGFNIPAAQGGLVFDYFYDYKKPSFNNESSYSDPGDTPCPDGVIIQKADGTLVDEVRYDYGYGEYIGNPDSGSCSNNTTALGMPPAGSSTRTSFMLNINPAIMNSADNDIASNWFYSTSVYDVSGNQIGTPGQQNDQVCVPNLIISGLSTTTGLNEASFNISSTGQIDGGAIVDYSAGTSVNLNGGFEVHSGSELNIYILGCN